MPKISMIEPQWGYSFLKFMVDLGYQHQWIQKWYPIGADIFVFVYPFFLTLWYLKGILKKDWNAKQEALFIFFSCFLSIGCTILSQQFFDKKRPLYEFAFDQTHQESLLHSFLPSTSFPSDHAVVTFSIAMATLWIGIKHRNTTLKIWSGFLFLFAIITGLCRIGITVHWTTDILAGMGIGLLVPTLLSHPRVYHFLETRIINPLIRLEEKIITSLFGYKSH